MHDVPRAGRIRPTRGGGRGAASARLLALAAALLLVAATSVVQALPVNAAKRTARPSFVRHVVPAGRFGQVVEAVGVGDIDGNGRADIVVAGDRFLLRYGRPAAQPILVATGTFGAGAQTLVHDVDRDGRADIVTGEVTAGARREVWFADTPEGWRRHVLSSSAYCHDIVFASLDSSGRAEAVCVDQQHDRIVLLVQSSSPSSAWSARPIEEGINAMGAAVADVDGDGRPDVVVGRAWYRNMGAAGWTRYPYTSLTSAEYPAFDEYAKVAVLDLDGDGRLDIVGSLFAESPAGQLDAFLAPGDPRRPDWPMVSLDPGPLFGVHSLVLARFDGCSRPELVVAETNVGGWDFGAAPDPRIVLYRLAGASAWTRTILDTTGAHDVQAADLDGDGRPDLVGHEENTDFLQPPRNGRVFWWHNALPRQRACADS